MNYLIAEMMTYLLGVAFLGVLVGWLFTRASYNRKVEDTELNLLNRLHDVEKELDISRIQLDKTTELLEEERTMTVDKGEMTQLQAKLEITEQQSDYTRDQILELNQTLDSVTSELRKAKDELKQAKQDNGKMQRDFDNIQDRLAVFQNDILEITENSGRLRTAFDEARMQLVAKDRRIAELESSSNESIQLAAATNGSSSEPELAISRIARLQTRVQELFDEVNRKDEKIEKLEQALSPDEESTEADNTDSAEEDNSKKFSKNGDHSTEDDLTLINGIDDLLEHRLNELGVNNLNDIAEWDDSDIDRIDFELQNFPGRIQTERWVEQARDLCNPNPGQSNRNSQTGDTRH